jgi:Zn-dependent metalloprotease
MAKNSERQLHSAVSTTRSVQRWPVTSQIIRAMVAVAAVFQFAVAQATEESPNQVALEAWPEETVVAFERVRLGEQSVIQGDVAVLFPDRMVAATPGVESDRTATVQGTVRTDVAATKLPSFPWFTPGGPEVRIAPGSSSNLSPGNYGRVTVGSSDGPPAVLTLAGGIYNIIRFQLGRGSRIECADACELRVLTTLRLDNSASLAPAQDAGIREEDIQLFVAGTDLVREEDIQAFIAGRDVEKAATVQLGEAAEIHGYLYAPNGTVVLGPATNATGHIIGRTVHMERAARASASPAVVSAGSTRVDQKELPVTRADGGVQTFRLEPDRQVRVEGLFVRNGTSFGLGPADTVVEDEARGSQESGLHHRYRQFHHGLPMLGADFIVQETKGLVISGIGRLVSGLDVDPNPELSDQAALELALKAIEARPDGSNAPQGTPPSSQGMLAIASKGGSMAPGSFHLVYRFEVAAPRTNRGEMIDIDARTGEIVNRFPLAVNYTASGSGDTWFYGWKPFLVDAFNTVEGQTRHRLRVLDLINPPPSAMGPKGLWTVRALGFNPIAGPVPTQGFVWQNYVVEDFIDEDGDFKYWPAPSFDEVTAIPPPVVNGVNLHWGLQQAVDYWKKANPPWIGMDGKGNGDLVAVIDCPEFFDKENAAFIPPKKLSTSYVSVPYLCFSSDYPSNFSISTIGHEFAHGVHYYATHAAEGYSSGEAGVVKEGIADLFAYLLDPNTSNWCGLQFEKLTLSYKGGSCGAPSSPFCQNEQCDPQSGVCSVSLPAKCSGRNLANPKSTGNPDTYVGDNWIPVAGKPCGIDPPAANCHHDSTIVGHWFYILLNGKQGTNDHEDIYNVVGIGRQKGEQIAQRALLQKLGSSPTFLSLREASIQAAEDLFGHPRSPPSRTHGTRLASVNHTIHARTRHRR